MEVLKLKSEGQLLAQEQLRMAAFPARKQQKTYKPLNFHAKQFSPALTLFILPTSATCQDPTLQTASRVTSLSLQTHSWSHDRGQKGGKLWE